MAILDAIIIADNGQESLGATNPLRLQMGGHVATLQVVRNALAHNGRIIPPIEGEGKASWASALKLNGIYLYNALAKAGFEAELIDDFRRERDRFAVLAAASPLAVVVSTTFVVSRAALFTLVRDIKRHCPRAVVIVGGPFVSFSWRVWQRRTEPLYSLNALRQDLIFFDGEGDEVDLYIISDTGDDLLKQALARLKAGQSLEGLPNTARQIAGEYRFTTRVDDVVGWEETPIDWAELPERVFESGVVTLRSSIGCPYRCNFCNFNKNRQLTRVKPLDLLVKEMKAVQVRGARYIWFADDNFRLGRRDLSQVCKRFIAEGLTLKWMTLLRAEMLQGVDPELLLRAGCVEVQMGIESADSTVLAAMNKQADPALNEMVVTRLLQAGIHCSCYFVIGFPGESNTSVDTTIAFLRRLEAIEGPGLLKWSLFPFVLAPGSPVYEVELRTLHGIEGHMNSWQHRTMDDKEARHNLLRVFMSMEKSGPIYRGDNLDQLRAMSPGQAKAFVSARHALEKTYLGTQADTDTVCKAFAEILT